MAGPMTWELVEDLGEAFGLVALLTGHPDTLAKGSTPTVRLFSAVPYQRGSFIVRAFSWLKYQIQAFFWLWSWPKEIPLLLFSNPPTLCWLGCLMSFLRGQRYAVMVHDIYPDVVINLGGFSERHLLFRLWRGLNRSAYECAEVVMTLGEHMASNLRKQFDPNKTKAKQIQVIYPWADTNRIKPLLKENNWFARKYGQVNKLSIMYSGNMGLGHDIETILGTARLLKENAKIHFLFIGAGPKWKLIDEYIEKENLKNSTLLPWQPEENLPFVLSTADIAFVSFEPGMEGLAIPSKAFYSMAAGSVILLISHGENELENIFREYKIDSKIIPGDVTRCVDLITNYCNNIDNLNFMREKSRRLSKALFSRELNSRKIVKILDSLGLTSSEQRKVRIT
jgi:colanic acid biosynthesis glycosyl transferase WcaI